MGLDDDRRTGGRQRPTEPAACALGLRRAVACLAALVALLLPTLGSTSPPTAHLFGESRKFIGAARHVQAEVRIQRGGEEAGPLLRGARAALEQTLRMERELDYDAPVTLSPEPPAGEPATLTLQRDKTLSMAPGPTGAAPAWSIPIDEVNLRRHPTEARLLALALGATRLERAFKRAGAPLEREVMTLDRIDGRLVWAVGGAQAAVWFDRETNRPVRLHFAAGVLDDDAWAVRMTYGDDMPGRGWFPHRLAIVKNGRVALVLHFIQVELSK